MSGLLFDDPVQAYVAMLAVLKAGAAYVPLDPAFPADRIAYIVSDAAATAVLSLSHLRPYLAQVRAEIVAVDDMSRHIAAQSRARVTDAERGPALDELAYIIYTSGSTGRPKGVAVEHRSIVQLRAGRRRGVRLPPDDRVYQGLTIAFDFSVEEIWVPWAVGATLVPKPAGRSLLGVDLHAFLIEQRVTALCCVPTLLATLRRTCRTCGSCWCRARPARTTWSALAPAGPRGSSTSTGRPRRRSPRPGPSSHPDTAGDHRRARCRPTRS